jgi:phosphopantothenoylcysteine decarboxylase/phosphopantothenate--cysteine ligase
MNGRMWEHPATVANVSLLRERGVVIAEPGTGRLASKGEHGTGRLAEPAELLALIESEVAEELERRQDLKGSRVLISAGGTREPLDAVRFIGNRSSGRMGFALAEAAAARGAYVTVVAANVALNTPTGVTRIDVETAAELQAACTEAWAYADVLIAAAAVADFRPSQTAAGKMKKQPGEETRSLELERTPDVLAGLAGARKDGQIVVGFAAEHGDGALAYGRDKLARKGLDAIVVNDISDQAIGFDSTENEVVIVTATDETPVPRGTKRAIADAILDVVGPLRQ